MKGSVPSKVPKFKNDEEIAAFMEKYSGFDLVSAGLATIIPTPFFVRSHEERETTLLKYKRVQIAFKDESSLRRTFASSISSTHTFLVIDTDPSGILLGFPESPESEGFYIPYLNISGIKILDGPKEKTV